MSITHTPDSPSGRLARVWSEIEARTVVLDTRWLSVFRIGFGLLLCAEVLRRWVAVGDFFSNAGTLSNHFSLFRPLGRGSFSIYTSLSTSTQVSVAFAITLVIFVLFTVGYKTRLFHLLSFVCITSLNARNLMVENGGTVAVNLLCFWTLFLPLGRRLSIDSLRLSLQRVDESSTESLNGSESLSPKRNQFHSLVAVALVAQWSVVYFFNFITKTGEGWKNGSALHYFLHQDRIVTPLGVLIREQVPAVVLRGFTFTTLVVEALLPVLLLLPVWQARARRLALVLAVGLHGGIALTARLGPFSYVMTMFFLLLLGQTEWGWLKAFFRARGKSLQVVFDDDCGVCFQICRVLRRLDLSRRLTFIGSSERERLPNDLSDELLNQTVVVLSGSASPLTHQKAIAAILRALPLAGLGVGWLVSLPGFSGLVGWGYRWLAPRRHEFSSALGWGRCGASNDSSSKFLQGPGGARSSRLADVLRGPLAYAREGLVIVALVLFVNQVALDNAALRKRVTAHQPEVLAAWVSTFRLMQGWRMFAPEPPFEDGHLVVDGRTVDGRIVDPLTGKRPDFDPNTQTGWGLSQFWCDFHLKMSFAGYRAYHKEFRDYLVRWSERTGRESDALESFDVWWVHDKSPPPGTLQGQALPPRKLFSHGKVKESLARAWLPSRQH